MIGKDNKCIDRLSKFQDGESVKYYTH